MRRIAKVDANQPDIVAALRKVGASVTLLSQVGGGCPDLLVGIAGVNLLMEVKDGSKPMSAQKMTPDQVEWHQLWRGQSVVVRSVEEAISALSILRGPKGQANCGPMTSA